jgi:transcriptional regulator with XRE-family HTH domain
MKRENFQVKHTTLQFGNRLKNIQIGKKLSQRDLALRASVKVDVIRDYENGHGTSNPQRIRNRYLNVVKKSPTFSAFLLTMWMSVAAPRELNPSPPFWRRRSPSPGGLTLDASSLFGIPELVQREQLFFEAISIKVSES